MEGITNKEIELWEKELQEGKTITELTKKYNRAYTVIIQAIRTKGLRKFRRLTTKEREEIKQEYRKNKSIYDIAKQFKITIGTVWYCIKKIAHNQRQKQINDFKKRLNKLTEFELGYIIGIIEGEGCITLYKDTDKRLRPILSISNNDKKILDYIFIRFKIGNIHSYKRRKNWNIIYEWKTQDKKLLLPLYEKLLPFAISKKNEIKCLVSWLKTKDINEYLKLKQIKHKKNAKVKL